MLRAQNYVCAICKKKETKMINGKVCSLCVDHNHVTGAIRELLCSSCNIMIGKAMDDICILSNAIDYLIKHKISNPLTKYVTQCVKE